MQRDDADRAVNQADLFVRQSQPAFFARIEQKNLDDFHELRLAQPVKQQKEQQHDDFRFLEKCAERFEKSGQKISDEPESLWADPPPVCGRMKQ